MPKETTIDTVAELQQLTARKVAEKEKFEADQRAATARLEQLYELQKPVQTLLIQRHNLRRRIANVEKLNQGYHADAAVLRQQLHENFQVTRERGALHDLHHRLVNTVSLAVETGKSLAILRDELAELEAQITKTAKELNLTAMLPDFSAPLDE